MRGLKKISVLFVGVGSIAKRHIKNLSKICKYYHIKLFIDLLRSGYGATLPSEIEVLIRRVYRNIDDVPAEYDILFITNPTSMHFKSILALHSRTKNFFIEKPLITAAQLPAWENIKIHLPGIVYVACPLRYTRVIQYLKEHISPQKVISVRCISSSYMPAWRPGQDYKNTYSAKKELGGGVSIDLIHEWDYITYLFGFPDCVHSFVEKVSDLDIDSDDLAVYIGRYSDKIVELHLDYFGRINRREVEVFTDNGVIVGDLVKGEVRYLCEDRTVILREQRDAYQERELEHYLRLISGEKLEYNNLTNAIKTIRLAVGAI
jgi:predicted dehydrogenase